MPHVTVSSRSTTRDWPTSSAFESAMRRTGCRASVASDVTSSPVSHWAVLGVCVAILSPLGYLLTIPLGEWTAQAAASFVAAM